MSIVSYMFDPNGIFDPNAIAKISSWSLVPSDEISCTNLKIDEILLVFSIFFDSSGTKYSYMDPETSSRTPIKFP
jgi:hypothetical protein